SRPSAFLTGGPFPSTPAVGFAIEKDGAVFSRRASILKTPSAREDTGVPPSAHTVVGYLRSLLARPPAAEAGDPDPLPPSRADGDGAAFASLVHRHGPRVLGLAWRVAGDHQTAEDVFQATFLLLARQAHAVRRPEAVGSWLSRTAFRLALRARRSQARRDKCEALAAPRAVPSPLDELTARELLTILDEQLPGLPATYPRPPVPCS